MTGSELIFWLPSECEVTVEGGDFFGTGRLPQEWGGVCLIEHTWESVTFPSDIHAAPTVKEDKESR
jgi:hypothetical protein